MNCEDVMVSIDVFYYQVLITTVLSSHIVFFSTGFHWIALIVLFSFLSFLYQILLLSKGYTLIKKIHMKSVQLTDMQKKYQLKICQIAS